MAVDLNDQQLGLKGLGGESGLGRLNWVRGRV